MFCCKKVEIDTKPELIIGLTGGVGTNFKQVKNILENILNNEFNYHVFLIKLSKIHEEIINNNSQKISSDKNKNLNNLLKKMTICTKLREKFNSEDLYAKMAVSRIKLHRNSYNSKKDKKEKEDYNPSGQVYIIDSLKKTRRI
ncbi:hypothetical protein [Fluviispira multicolorata]|uniref:Uncharacterized protein n=1 Tax=Fluviispira multicolorata TaxID=2654512 RepID=A0A833JE37_9BACT|nr:hypothetical protein [Fluviispira multicolorata]KAB8029235.1 hypothetical protein GCL57_11920 [Fluviispira multicolorata]